MSKREDLDLRSSESDDAGMARCDFPLPELPRMTLSPEEAEPIPDKFHFVGVCRFIQT